MKCLAKYRQLSQAAIFLEGEPKGYMLATYLHSCWIAIRCQGRLWLDMARFWRTK